MNGVTHKAIQTLTLVFLSGMAFTSQAAPVGASLTLSDLDGQNFADLTLVNDSVSAQITSFSVTIGDTSYGFDRFLDPLGGCGTVIASCTLNSPDNIQNNIGESIIDIDFTGFDPGETLSIVDIDVDFATGSANDYDSDNRLDVIMFNNGVLPNGVFSVSFSSGETLSLVLPDSADAPSYTFQVAVPIPAAVWLFGSGLGLLGWIRARGTRKKTLDL